MLLSTKRDAMNIIIYGTFNGTSSEYKRKWLHYTTRGGSFDKLLSVTNAS